MKETSVLTNWIAGLEVNESIPRPTSPQPITRTLGEAENSFSKSARRRKFPSARKFVPSSGMTRDRNRSTADCAWKVVAFFFAKSEMENTLRSSLIRHGYTVHDGVAPLAPSDLTSELVAGAG